MNRHIVYWPYWLMILLLGALVGAKFSPQTGFTSLIRFGETWQERRNADLLGLPIATVPQSNGYDGQFYAQIAIDPLLRSDELAATLDAPAYRSRRILAPALAAGLGFGSPWWTLQAYALLNVLCWFALAWLMHRQIGTKDPMAWPRWVGCVLSMGVLESVRQSLVDLPALLLLALAVKTASRSCVGRSTIWLTLANLTKETSLLSSLALLCDPTAIKQTWHRACFSLLVCSLPLAAWSYYVHLRFPGSSTTDSLGNFTWPFLGLLAHVRLCISELLDGNWDGRYSMGLVAAISVLLQILILMRNRQPRSAWWRIGAVHAVLCLFLGTWVWSGYWAVCRALLPLTIAFNLLLPSGRGFWPLWLLGNITILHALWRFL